MIKPGDTVKYIGDDLAPRESIGMTVKVIRREGSSVFVKGSGVCFWTPIANVKEIAK